MAAQIVLTETDALARLSAESPRVRAIRATLDVTRADVLAAARWPNPRLIYDRESAGGVTENMTTVLQPLPITGRRGLDIRAASALVDASSRRVEDELRRARADLRLAFTDLQAAQTRERELTLARDRLQELSGMLQKREAAGDTAGFDRLRAAREVLDVDADRLTAAMDRARAQATLASFFTGTLDQMAIVVSDIRAPRAMLPTVEEMVARALTVRGELLALEQEVEAARLHERAADRRRIPEPEVIAGTKSSSVGDTGGVLALQASIPIFDRAAPERALARARAAQAQARAEAFRLVLRTQIAALRAIAIERREQAERYRASATSSADQVERIAQVSYDAGERGILELLDAYRTAASARVRQATLDAAARQAEIELEFVSGWEIP
jgi:cobalt-zinc-cadmium efflux system outer membrane protein